MATARCAAWPSSPPASRRCRPPGTASTTPTGPDRTGALMAYGGYGGSGGGSGRPKRRFQPSRRNVIIVTVAAAIFVFLISTNRINRFEIIYFLVLIPSIILHEISHGVVALAFGADTAKKAGRLTLNPLAHVDPVGTLLVPAVLSLSGVGAYGLALIHISEPTRRTPISYAVFCLKKKKHT